MSTQKTVYNKLFSKQELSAEKVELSLKDDIIKLEGRAESFRSQALKSLGDAIQGYESAIHSHGVALDASERGLSQAEELGADEIVKYMRKSIDFNKGTIKILEKAVSNLKNNRVS